MKSNAPWSVKGIERDARETAKAAAQREGMTVGEWLNQIIYNAGDPDAAPHEGEIEGLKARDLAAAIEHLARRISAAETKSAEAVDNLSRSLGGAVERLQRMERAEPSGDGALAERVRHLEEKSTDRQRIEALRALERAVGQIAVQFSNAQETTHARLDATEKQLQSIAARLEAGGREDSVSAAAVRDAIEGMVGRISRAEKIASEAARLKAEANESVDADFVHKTGLRLRILGDEIKRGGDQIRTLESSIGKLTQQIDAAEKRSAEGVQKVAETIADLRTQFAGADATDQAAARAEIEAAVSEITQRTEDRIEQLQRSFDDMVSRLESSAGRRAPVDAPMPTAAPAPVASAEADIDQELEDAFAALDLEEPIPTPAAPPAPEAAASQRADDEDDFGFDAEEKPDADTADVLAEIREAFGIDEPEDEDEEAAPEDIAQTEDEPQGEFADEEATDDLPPVVASAARGAEGEQSQADYLKAARKAAREAAARAAAEAQEGGKKKLTPKQRAILAARIKRRKAAEAEAAMAAAAPLVAEPPVETAGDDEKPADASSLKARVMAIAEKIRRRGATKRDDQPSLDAPVEDDEKPAKNPSLVAGMSGAMTRFKVKPSGGVIALAIALLLLIAALFLIKDMFGKQKAVAPAPAAAIEEATQVGSSAEDERIEPQSAPTDPVRPRDLYLDNIAALKNATTDEEARAALGKIEQAATLGHPPAQLQIGELYKLGQLYDRDLAQARIWFERAANGGNVLAMHRLGVMSARGEGGPVDPQSSAAWFEKAANFGLVDSQYNLGATYHPTPEGAAGGVQANIQDRAKAYFWYSVAARNGDAQAGEMAAGLAASMPAAEKSAKDAEVAAWAAKTPDPAANELAPN